MTVAYSANCAIVMKNRRRLWKYYFRIPASLSAGRKREWIRNTTSPSPSKRYWAERFFRGTAGLMVYARGKQAAAALSRAIADGAFQKEYLALVHGCPPETGTWEDLLFKDSRKNKVFVVKRPRAGVRAAKLRYQVIRPGEEGSFWKPAAAIRYGCNFPPEATLWWVTTNTAAVPNRRSPCFSPLP